MNYKVTRDDQQIGQWFETAADAWQWIDKQRHLETVQGLHHATLKAYYNPTGQEVARPAPRIEHTPAGAQTVIAETPARQVPKAPLRAKRPQNDSPLALELPAIEAQQFKLF